MNVAFEASFVRDLRKIRDKVVLERVEQVIAQVKAAGSLAEIMHLSKLRGHTNFYCLRLGDYRIGLEVIEERVILVRLLHRRDVYRYFP